MRTLTLLLAALLAGGPAAAAQTRWFRSDTPETLDGAVGVGVAIGRDGTMCPLPPLAPVATFDEPLGLALAVTPDGTAYVGTGHPARVWRVRAGHKELVAETAADQITALLVAPDGVVFIATASPAELLRLPRGAAKVETVSRLAEGNIWDLIFFRGQLIAAAGNPGRLLRLGKNGLEVAAAVPDRHARCLAVSGDTLLVGTSGKGLVMRWTGVGEVGAFFDSGFTEVTALAAGGDGAVYAAALTGDPTLGAPPKPSSGDVAVAVSTGGETPPTTDKGTATSEILKITPEGAATILYSFTKQLAGTLAWGDDGLTVGTGMEGQLWRLVEGSAAQLDAVDAAQVVRVADGGEWVLTQGPVRLMKRAGMPRGSVTSPVLDAEQPSHWGAAVVATTDAAHGTCAVRFRSGATATADDTWSNWSAARPCGALVADAPPARYLQWRLELSAPVGSRFAVSRVNVAYRQVNLAPEIKALTVHPPGAVFLKGPPPSEQIVDVKHPDLNGIFTTIGDDESGDLDRLGKRYWRVGYQSVSWKVEDPNKDPLRFKLEIQREGSEGWWTVRDRMESTVIAFDTQALADGLYRVRLTADDGAANPLKPLTTQRLSSWFSVDNTPPRITLTRQGADWLVTVDDALSPIAVVEWNRDAEAWHQLQPDDGLLDQPHETFHIHVAAGRHVFSVRAVDDHHNRVVATVEEGP
jgi:hypothetical protein